MPSSPRVPTAGAPPPGAARAPAVVHTLPWEGHPVKEVGAVGAFAQETSPRLPRDENSEAKTLEHEEKVNRYQPDLAEYLKAKYFSGKAFEKSVGRSRQRRCAAAQKARSGLPWDKNSESKTLEHEENVSKYQAMLAARLKSKYFSGKAFDKGDVFEETTIHSETIQLSRWPFTSLFADPATFCREKRCTEKNMCPSLTAASSAKCNPPSLAGEASKWPLHMNTTLRLQWAQINFRDVMHQSQFGPVDLLTRMLITISF